MTVNNSPNSSPTTSQTGQTLAPSPLKRDLDSTSQTLDSGGSKRVKSDSVHFDGVAPPPPSISNINQQTFSPMSVAQSKIFPLHRLSNEPLTDKFFMKKDLQISDPKGLQKFDGTSLQHSYSYQVDGEEFIIKNKIINAGNNATVYLGLLAGEQVAVKIGDQAEFDDLEALLNAQVLHDLPLIIPTPVVRNDPSVSISDKDKGDNPQFLNPGDVSIMPLLDFDFETYKQIYGTEHQEDIQRLENEQKVILHSLKDFGIEHQDPKDANWLVKIDSDRATIHLADFGEITVDDKLKEVLFDPLPIEEKLTINPEIGQLETLFRDMRQL